MQLNRPSSSQTRWLWKLLGILDTCGESVDSLMDRLILKHFIWIYRRRCIAHWCIFNNFCLVLRFDSLFLILVKQRVNSPYTSSTLLLLHYYNLRKSRTDLKSEVWFFVWGVPLNFATDYLKLIQIGYKLGVSFNILVTDKKLVKSERNCNW